MTHINETIKHASSKYHSSVFDSDARLVIVYRVGERHVDTMSRRSQLGPATETRQYGEHSLCVAGGTRVFTPSLPVSGSDTVPEFMQLSEVEVMEESEEDVEMMSCDCWNVSTRSNLVLVR